MYRQTDRLMHGFSPQAQRRLLVHQIKPLIPNRYSASNTNTLNKCAHMQRYHVHMCVYVCISAFYIYIYIYVKRLHVSANLKQRSCYCKSVFCTQKLLMHSRYVKAADAQQICEAADAQQIALT